MFQRFSDDEEEDEEDNDQYQQQIMLQNLAQSKGLRPELAAAAAAAVVAAQQKQKEQVKSTKKLKEKRPNANLEPLGNIRQFSGKTFADSGACRKVQNNVGEILAMKKNKQKLSNSLNFSGSTAEVNQKNGVIFYNIF